MRVQAFSLLSGLWSLLSLTPLLTPIYSQFFVFVRHPAQFMESRTICPRAGLLVMFPAWVSHSVTPLLEASLQAENTEGRRLAVAFNVDALEDRVG